MPHLTHTRRALALPTVAWHPQVAAFRSRFESPAARLQGDVTVRVAQLEADYKARSEEYDDARYEASAPLAAK